MQDYMGTILNALMAWATPKFDKLFNTKADKVSDEEIIELLIKEDLLPAVSTSSGAILTDQNGNIILRY